MPVQTLGGEDPLEEEMATPSSILAWKISWVEKPGGLQSRGLQSQTWLKWLTTLFWRGVHGRREKKLRYCKSQIKALMSDGYHFNIHQMSFIPQWRNSTTEKVNIDEQKRWERDAAEDRAGCWPHIRAVFRTLEVLRESQRICCHNKQTKDNQLSGCQVILDWGMGQSKGGCSFKIQILRP